MRYQRSRQKRGFQQPVHSTAGGGRGAAASAIAENDKARFLIFIFGLQGTDFYIFCSVHDGGVALKKDTTASCCVSNIPSFLSMTKLEHKK